MKVTDVCFVALLMSLLSACGNRQDVAVDFDKALYVPEYAGGFTIEGADGNASSVITVQNPWQGADSVQLRLFIARNGEEAPEGFDGQVLDGDARRIVTMSSSQIAMLDAVGAADFVAGLSGMRFVTNPSVLSRRDSVGDVGYDGNINYEVLVSLEPDIVLLYGVNGASVMEDKLKELGIPFMYVGDYLEESPLGKAEWLVALAEICGRRERGEAVFKEIPRRYNALKELVAENAADAPSVMLNTPYNDIWFMPSVKSYFVRLIEDAGGRFIYSENTGNSSAPIDMEEAYILASQADMWLNPGQAKTLGDVVAMVPKFADIRCLRNGYVYNNNLRSTAGGGNDFYESSVVHPDLVLRDLVKIFHPELVQDDFYYYQKLK